MLIRIVKMTFRPGAVESFLEIFEQAKFQIRAFEGCQHLELLRDLEQPTILLTYSYWENEKHLERYRHSELFASTWAKTKVLFDAKAKAFSVERLQIIE